MSNTKAKEERKKIRIGVVGVNRGGGMIYYCKCAKHAEVVAICDKWEDGLMRQKKVDSVDKSLHVTYYTDYDEFLTHDMDAVVLANYAHQHAPFAIKAMKAGKHVFSEVLPCQNMKEAVELIETVEETGKIYAYAENYCYMPGPYEMRRLYREGKIGEFEYAEGEYVHNCETIWPMITYGERDHWRNRNDYSTFYCTHSLGPIIHMTGLRPVSVIGIEGVNTERISRYGYPGVNFGMELVTMENGGVVKSLHGGLYKDSIWWTLYGSHGRMETARYDADMGGRERIYVNDEPYSGSYAREKADTYLPIKVLDNSEEFGHGGSDFWSMWNFVEKILGNPVADTIDVYEAMDMFLPGLFAYRSILQGGVRMEIPNLRDKYVREQYRNDVACTDIEVAGEDVLPLSSHPEPDIPDSVYERLREEWIKETAANRAREDAEWNIPKE